MDVVVDSVSKGFMMCASRWAVVWVSMGRLDQQGLRNTRNAEWNSDSCNCDWTLDA